MSDDEYFVDDNDDYESEFSEVDDLDLENEEGEVTEIVEGGDEVDKEDAEIEGEIEGEVEGEIEGEIEDIDDEEEIKVDEPEEEEMIIIEDYKGDHKHRMIKKITQKFMTKYEKARILGCRAIQLSKGAKPLIDIYINRLNDPIEIAKQELKSKVIPLIIRRYLPDGRFEDWDVNDLIIF